MSDLQIIPPGRGTGLVLKRGQLLRVVDPEGGQSGDVLAFSRDGRQRLSNGRTFDYGGKLYLSTGDVLWSDASEPLLTIVSDDVGRHDFLYATCSREMFRIQYGAPDHLNCTDSLRAGLESLGIQPGPIPTAFNVFMNVDVAADGRLIFGAPRSRAGDAIVFRAEQDLAVAVSACPALTCNGGGTATKPLAFQLINELATPRASS
jgi:uncharacterized protein YcgI (DUF1989 family)